MNLSTSNNPKSIIMTAKSLFTTLFVAITLTIATPGFATNSTPTTTTATTNTDPRAEELMNRLNEIKDMDKSSLSRTDKKELRKEVKGIKKEMKALKGGVYLSVGAIIIIILLLILLS
jgi:hypothetical protein